jgi:hypothetical protein
MIGIATRLAALRTLRNRMASASDPQLNTLAQLIDDNPGWAHYGAIGPAWGDLGPTHIDMVVFGQPGVAPYAALWKRIFNVYGGDGTPTNPGLRPVLQRIRDLLSQLEAIAAAEDLSALQGMESEVNTINQIATDLTAILVQIKGDGTLTNLGIVPEIAQLIREQNRPAIIKPRPDGQVGFPPKFWTLREFLSWRRTGRFARKLWDRAQSSGKDELKAYALGWLSTWSVCAGGASAVASVIGAPYRNEWWRARFVANYFDLWSHGYAEAGPASAPYTPWPNLCDGELHSRIEVPGTAFDPDDLMENLRLEQPLGSALPEFFTDYFVQCYDDVYGDLGSNRPKLDADILQDAYAMTWLVLWFQTSPDSLGCHHTAPVAPSSCGGAPSWTNPVVPGDAGGGVGGPPAPSIDPKVKPENIVCAILLAILGIVAICFGGYAAGGAAIAGAIALAVSAGTIDWDKFRCDLAWYRLYLYNGLRALHDVLSLGGLVHPYKLELSQDTTAVHLLEDLPTTIRTGDNIIRTQTALDGYPKLPWTGSGFSWFDPPTGGVENPPTIPCLAEAYASGFLDDPANPFGSASVFDPSPFPYASQGTAGAAHIPVGFINSADAVIGWLTGAKGDFPDRNLDGDRGLGYLCWSFVDDTWSDPVNIVQES